MKIEEPVIDISLKSKDLDEKINIIVKKIDDIDLKIKDLYGKSKK